MQLLHRPADAGCLPDRPARAAAGRGPVLDSIRERGVLRVGYIADSLPFAFFNGEGELVGFDVELAHRLARELGVKLEFVPVDRATLDDVVAAGSCDIVMSGVVVTTARAASDAVFGVLPRRNGRAGGAGSTRDEFSRGAASVRAVRRGSRFRTCLTTSTRSASRCRGPNCASSPTSSACSRAPRHVDAIAMTAERGSAWTLRYPRFSVVVPQPGHEGAARLSDRAGTIRRSPASSTRWIELKRKDGTIDTLYDYWVLGHDAAPPRPRWSIIRNVLHWVN